MAIKAIVFDVGGVLVDDPNYNEFWVGKGRELRGLFGRGKIDYSDFVKQGSDILDMSEDDFRERYEEAYSLMKLMPESFDIFSNIELDRYIFSDTNPFHLKVIHEKFPDIFSGVVKLFASPEIGFRKDEDGSYNSVIAGIGIFPEEILFVDNKSNYTDKAESFGIKTILFKDAGQLKRDLEKYGVEV